MATPADLISDAKATPIEAEIERRGIKLRGRFDRYGPCPVCRDGTDRFSINVRKQVFRCRHCNEKGGDVIALVQWLDDCTFNEAVAELTGKDIEHPTPRRPSASPGSAVDPLDVARREIVRTMVAKIVPLTSTPGERYLRDVRKIDVDAIRDVLDRTDAIGWHPDCYFNEVGHKLHGRRLGAIVAIMTDPVTAKPTGAISRTYLTPDGEKVMRAKTLGAPRGIIRLTPDDEVLDGLHIAEGLETALAGMSIGWRPMWAMGDAGMLASFPALAGIEALTVFVDRDTVGEKAAHEVEARWRASGREVNLFYPKEGDLNDALKGLSA